MREKAFGHDYEVIGHKIAEMVGNLYEHEIKAREAEIERLRQTNKLLSDLFHEAVALPQGVCPRPATASDGMFNPQHRALNKATGGE